MRSGGEKCAPGRAPPSPLQEDPGTHAGSWEEVISNLPTPGSALKLGVNLRTGHEGAAIRPECAEGESASHPAPGSHTKNCVSRFKCSCGSPVPPDGLIPAQPPNPNPITLVLYSQEMPTKHKQRFWCLAVAKAARTGLLEMIILNNKARKGDYKHSTLKAHRRNTSSY